MVMKRSIICISAFFIIYELLNIFAFIILSENTLLIVKYIFLIQAFLLLLFFMILKYILFPIKRIETKIVCMGISISKKDKTSWNIKHLFCYLNKLLDMENDILTNHDAALYKKQAKLSLLQKQINPHFLYNTLEAIRSESITQHVPQIAKMTRALAMFFRYSIDTEDELVTIEDELKNINYYFEIQKYRFNNRFDLKININPDDKIFLKCLIPKLTIQPIVENCIFHGLETKLGPGDIRIHFLRTMTRFIICISDNGVGIEARELRELNDMLNDTEMNIKIRTIGSHSETGIGLVNINQRIKLAFGDDYGIIVRSVKKCWY